MSGRAGWRIWLFLGVLLLTAAACNFPRPRAGPAVPSTEPAAAVPRRTVPAAATSTPAAATVTPEPLPSYQSVFEPAPCAFETPKSHSPECGYLLVPQDRSRPEGAWIRLHTAIFRSRAASPAPDPVIHLAGGPGSSSLQAAPYIFQQGMDAVLETRDFIFFDQRGTGFSQPRLDCPERFEIIPGLLENPVTDDENIRLVRDAFLRCRDRLTSEGVDLSMYNSAASAADINDLRLALGYEQLNLYGVSYGTRLALTLMRDHPDAVRSAVLDSTYPLQVNLYRELPYSAGRAFNRLFEYCAADPECSTAFPNLRSVFFDLVDELNASPVPVTLFAGGAERRVTFTGDLLIDVLFVGLYQPAVAAYMPEMIFDIRQGDFDILRQRLRLYYESPGAFGMQMSVQCSEEILLPSVEPAGPAPSPQIAGFFAASTAPFTAVCQEWSGSEPDPIESQPVISDLPVLVLAGEHDPITPPSWGQMVAADLTNAAYYEFPANGHWVTRSSPCAQQMALAFWENPEGPLDAACISSIPSLKFYTGP